jgi:hypothetical protein
MNRICKIFFYLITILLITNSCNYRQGTGDIKSETINSNIKVATEKMNISNDSLNNADFKNKLKNSKPFFLAFWKGMNSEEFKLAIIYLIQNGILNKNSSLSLSTNNNEYAVGVSPTYDQDTTTGLSSITFSPNIKSQSEFNDFYTLYTKKYGNPVKRDKGNNSIAYMYWEMDNINKNLKKKPDEKLKDPPDFYEDNSYFFKGETVVNLNFTDNINLKNLIKYDPYERYKLNIIYYDISTFPQFNPLNKKEIKKIIPSKEKISSTYKSI